MTDLYATLEDLYHIEDMRQKVQRHRIQMGNREAASAAGRSAMNPALAIHFAGRFQDIEDELTALIKLTIEEHEMWPWLDQVKGIGPGLAAQLVAFVDIEKAPTISSLWKFAGQAVNNKGEADRRVKGQKLEYNAKLKRSCYLVEESFMRSSSPYRRIYDEAKEQYLRTRPDWTPKHIDMACKRKMVKVFLSHMWLVWRHVRGLPIGTPYAQGVLGHEHIHQPWDFVKGYDYSWHPEWAPASTAS